MTYQELYSLADNNKSWPVMAAGIAGMLAAGIGTFATVLAMVG